MQPWLPKTVIKAVRLLLLWAALAWCAGAVHAQTGIPANARLLAPSAIPKFGTFISLYKTKEPPLPFLKPMYAEAGLPVYWLGGNRYLVDDTSLDWAAIEEERLLLQAAAAALAASSASQLDGGGVGLMGCNYTSNDLWLEISAASNQTVVLTVHTPAENGTYDIYFLPDLNWQRWQWRRVICGAPGQRDFVLPMPEPNQGFFVALDAADADGDGLGNGYESWFRYGTNHTVLAEPDSDGDGLRDGWEVEYGLDPTSTAGVNGASGNEDGDGPNLSNKQEHDAYYAAASGFDATFDPLMIAPANRPVITIAPASGTGLGFTISRDVGVGGTKPSLTVYYALGGTAQYGTDYTLDTPPSGLPRVCAVQFGAGVDSVTVAIVPTAAGLAKGRLSVVAAITPHGVAAASQVQEPRNWAYVVDWNHNRAINYFDGTPLGAGFMINLDRDTETGHLTIRPTANTTPLPFINVASSGRGTVARIEVPSSWNPSLTASRVAGEYYTCPNGGQANGPGNPSRTTVDRYGNVWVGNRDIGYGSPGAATKIGVVLGGTRGKKLNGVFVPDQPGQAPGEHLAPPYLYNTCVDRDGDGLLRTSFGLNNRIAWSDSALPPGDGDEAVIYYVRTTPENVRSVAVDRDNNVWVGSRDNGWQEMIDATTGAPVTGMKLLYGKGGYGAVVDPYGLLWSAGYAHDGLLRLPPGMAANVLPGTAGGILPGAQNGYGIGIDPTTADIWLGDFEQLALWHFTQGGCSRRFSFTPGGGSPSTGLKGIAVDGTGSVWVAHSGNWGTAPPYDGQEVYRFRNTGEYLGAVLLTHPANTNVIGRSPHGVCVDSQQRIWAVCFAPAQDGKYYAMRIDPSLGSVGQVVEAVELGSFPDFDGEYHGPYNYSDMSGFVALSATQPAGVWDFVQDSGTDHTLWTSATLDTTLNGGDLVVEVRAADRVTDLPSWPFRRLTGSSGTLPFGMPALKGRYLEVRVNLLREFGAQASPVLKHLSLAWGGPASALQITNHPRSQIVEIGGSAVFTVGAVGTGLSYQWFKDGVPVGTGSFVSVTNAQAADAGRYKVRVTDPSGASLDSAEARLHVVSTPAIGRRPSVQVDNATPVLGQSVGFAASMDVSPSHGPVYFQWRKNGAPIAGAHGQCATSDNQIYTADCSISSVACQDTGEYSVVFTNEYWRVASWSDASSRVIVTVVDQSYIPVPMVTVTISYPMPITDRQNPPVLAATACFTAVCSQWYRTDSMGGRYFKEPIPGANTMQYTFPNPVPCTMLNTWDYFMIEVFDESGFPHRSVPVRVYGDCEP